MSAAAPVSSVWDEVHGQPRAVAQLRAAAARPVHAYLFSGPPGSTKDRAARGFAAALISGEEDAAGRDARLVMTGAHPDVREIHRVGASISRDQVSEIIRLAAMSPVEGERQVMILHEFHLLGPEGAARLLKTLEEPPPSTVFVILADQVPPELVTIASRCVRVEFARLSEAVIAAALVGEGVDAAIAETAAASAGGSLDRARVLAADEDLEHRRRVFAAVPSRLDGSGHAVISACSELFTLIEAAAAPLIARQQAEIAELDERVKALGERGSGRKALEDRHKRELRRHRTDELRAGLSVIAGVYRDRLVSGDVTRVEPMVRAVERVHQTLERLDRNPNEQLQLQALLLALPGL